MGKAKWLVSVVISIGVIGLVQVGMAQALSFNSGSNVSVSQEQIDSTVFAAGQTVDISANVDGDVFCAGQTVNISGNVAGDIICAGQTVNITGDVDGDVRVAGQTVTVNGTVDGSLTAAGQTFTLSKNASIGRDASIGSNSANINGRVERDLLAGGDVINISGVVNRDVVAAVSKLTFADSAVVEGDVDYTSDKEAKVADGAQINGEIVRTKPTHMDNQLSKGEIFGIGMGFFIYSLISLLVVALALTFLTPGLLHRTTEQAMRRPWRVLLAGFLAAVAMPVAIFLLMVSFIGIPLGIVILLASLLLLSVSGVFSGYYLGRQVFGSQTNPLLIMLGGGSLLVVLYFIPVLGLITLLGAVWLGVGMMLLELFDRSPKPVYNTKKLKK